MQFHIREKSKEQLIPDGLLFGSMPDIDLVQELIPQQAWILRRR